MLKVLNLVVNGTKVNTGVRHTVIGGNKGREPMTNPEHTNYVGALGREILSISKVINNITSKGILVLSAKSALAYNLIQNLHKIQGDRYIIIVDFAGESNIETDSINSFYAKTSFEVKSIISNIRNNSNIKDVFVDGMLRERLHEVLPYDMEIDNGGYNDVIFKICDGEVESPLINILDATKIVNIKDYIPKMDCRIAIMEYRPK